MAYMTDWYKLPRKTMLSLILIIMQSSHTIKITAGKLVQLSIATFGDVRNAQLLMTLNKILIKFVFLSFINCCVNNFKFNNFT